MTDLTGNGHDIQLYNFAFAESSGYGLYYVKSLSSWTANTLVTKEDIGYNIYHIKNGNYSSAIGIRANYTKDFTIKVKIHEVNGNCGIISLQGGTIVYLLEITEPGVYSVAVPYNSEASYNQVALCGADFTVELLPDYQGALVSDGVDDYGWCENFPILTKESGCTICAIRQKLKDKNSNSCLLANRTRNGQQGAFSYELFISTNLSYMRIDSFGATNDVNKNNYPSLFTYGTSVKYNSISIKTADVLGNNGLVLFDLNPKGFTGAYADSIALYALEIYDRDLTDEEIEKVKARMMAEYEAKTGDVSMSAVARYECYDKTNEDSDRDILTDLSGNGHDISLKNFLFSEGSGYGKYLLNFNNSSSFYNPSFNKEYVKNDSFKLVATESITSQATFYKSHIITEPTTIKFKFNTNQPNYTFVCVVRYDDGAAETQNLVIGENIIQTNNTGCTLNISCKNDINAGDYISIEQIPEYKGALVSDGIDDYGLCDNFPIFTPDKGYTVCAIRKWIKENKNNYFISLATKSSYDTTFIFEVNFLNNSYNYQSFGGSYKTVINPNLFSYMTSVKANGENIIPGNKNASNQLTIFSNNNRNSNVFSSIALYALEIYDRDLTDNEIANVKERMIKRYEEKTGNKYEEVTT